MDVKNRQQVISKILMKAWRERWTEYEFGTQIKVVFGKGPRLPADSYNLTDAILQQTLIGAGVNKLLLSYLKHSLFSQLISYPAVIKRTTQYVHFEKSFCIKALLDFLISIINGVTCRNKAEENALMESLLSLVLWLIEMTERLLVKIVENNNVATKEQEQCLERITAFTRIIVQNQFLMGVLYLAKLEDRETYEKVVMGYKKIHNWNKHDAVKDLYQMVFVKLDYMELTELEPRNVESISFCLQPLISIEVLVNSSADTSTHVSKFLMIQKLKRYSTSRLYFEIIRSCFMTMCHVKEFNYRLWAAFFLFKIPQVLKQIHVQTKKADDKLDYTEDIVKAFDMLMECTPILDLLDTAFQCNSVKSILVELMKQNLINDDNRKKIVDKRELAIEKLEKFNIPSTPPIINEFAQSMDPTFKGLILALRDPIKPGLIPLLCSLLVDNRAFLLYSVAGVKGKHKIMVNGIMKWNDSCKDFYGEAAKNKLLVGECSNIFDISFILLYSIMQRCGLENFPEMNTDFFFEKWVREGMADTLKSKSPMSIVKMCDQSKVDEMIGYFRDSNNQQQPAISLKWNEICMNLPAMLYNVLIAWENDTISPVDVKNILNNMRSKMCCFAVISASWLCAYIKVLNEDEQAKPKVMIQQLMKPLDESIMKIDTFSEKFSLTHEIIMNLFELNSPNDSLAKHTQQKPLDDLFNDLWKEISEKKYLPFDAAMNLEKLFKSCGAFWLMKNLVDQIFKCKFIKDMETTMDIVFAIMHLNIEACTKALLQDILPILLFNKNQCSKMKESQSKMLAKLSVYSILSTMEITEINRKRPREDDDDLSPMSKMRKTAADQSTASGVEGSTGDKEQSSQLKESLKNSLQELFKIFHQQVLTDEISPKVNFIFQFLLLLVQSEKSVKLKPILKLIPNGIIMNLVKIIPDDDLTYGFVLRLYDLSVSSGRTTAMSDLCLLRNILIRKSSVKL